jgi:hypothetical protein
MLSLAEFQFTLAADLLDGGMRTARLLPGDPRAVMEALRIHRNTVLTGLSRSLRLTYPTIAWLTGENFFDQAAVEFCCARPPRGACLSDYGAEFPGFLENYAPAAGLPYLADVARFDLTLERCANHAGGPDTRVTLDGAVSLVLDNSLVSLALEYPADLLRDAYDTRNEEALATIDMTPGARNYAIWRNPEGASVRKLSPAAAAFLGLVLRSGDSEAALVAGMMHASAEEALSAIQSEILGAPFARIIQGQGEAA